MFERTLRLIDSNIFSKIENSSILLIGLGGVGGYALEALVRSGFKNITVVDFDVFDITNLNRQILATQNTLGERKVFVGQKRAELIRKDIKISALDKRLTKEDITEEFIKPYDYIIDACDTISVKVKLIEITNLLKKKCISSMGTANRFHPEMLTITTLKQTSNDPLAKKIRSKLKNNNKALKTPVVWSREVPIKNKDLGTICSVPMCAGSLLTSYIINDIRKEEL